MMAPVETDQVRYVATRWGPEMWGPTELKDNGVYVETYEQRESPFGPTLMRSIYRIRDLSIQDVRLRNGFYCPPQWSLHNQRQLVTESRGASFGRPTPNLPDTPRSDANQEPPASGED